MTLTKFLNTLITFHYKKSPCYREIEKEIICSENYHKYHDIHTEY